MKEGEREMKGIAGGVKTSERLASLDEDETNPKPIGLLTAEWQYKVHHREKEGLQRDD